MSDIGKEIQAKLIPLNKALHKAVQLGYDVEFTEGRAIMTERVIGSRTDMVGFRPIEIRLKTADLGILQ